MSALFKQTHDDMLAVAGQIGTNADDGDSMVKSLYGDAEQLAATGFQGPPGQALVNSVANIHQIANTKNNFLRENSHGISDFANAGSEAAQHGASYISSISI